MPTSLLPCWVQTTAAAREDPRRPGAIVVARPTHDGGVAVGGQRDGAALTGGSSCSRADQLASLLGPDTAAAREDPRRPGAIVVDRPTHDGRVAVGGQRDGDALSGGSSRSRADQLASLLGPDTAAAREDPRRPGAVVVARPTHDGRVAVGGQRDGEALSGGSSRSRADQLASLLGPDTAAARVDPRRPGVVVVDRPTHDGRVAVGGQRDGGALIGRSPAAPVPTSLLPCWVQTPPLRVKTHAAPAPLLSTAHPRWPCCRRRTARRRCLVWRLQSLPCRPACLLAGSRHRRCACRPTPPRRRRCRTAHPRWPCCRRRTARRRCLVWRLQSLPCRPACFLAGSRHRRCACRPTPPRRRCCRPAHPRWPCCRRRTARRSSLVWRLQSLPCRPACFLAGSRHRRCACRPTPPRRSLLSRPTHDGRVAVGGQRDGVALSGRLQSLPCRPASAPVARTGPGPFGMKKAGRRKPVLKAQLFSTTLHMTARQQADPQVCAIILRTDAQTGP